MKCKCDFYVLDNLVRRYIVESDRVIHTVDWCARFERPNDLDAQLAAKDAEIAELKEELRKAEMPCINHMAGALSANSRAEAAEARVKELEKKLLAQTEATAQMATTADNASRDARMWRESFAEARRAFDCTGYLAQWDDLLRRAHEYDGSSGEPWRAP
jgi:hypothetical protein